MPYRLTYRVDISWVGTGQGPLTVPAAQRLTLVQKGLAVAGQDIVGTGAGGAIAGADITTITNAMAADIAAQLNASPTLGNIQAWATTGGG